MKSNEILNFIGLPQDLGELLLCVSLIYHEIQAFMGLYRSLHWILQACARLFYLALALFELNYLELFDLFMS
jgi:hypothetical protein